MKFLTEIPYIVLVPIAVLMALTPFKPQPHLFEKVGWLFNGTLTRPLDIFDLLMHAAPMLLLAAKFVLCRRGSSQV